MHILPYGLASLVALAIIVIGALYIAVPRTAATGFGLREPGGGSEVDWWLRLKGVRDIVSGLAVFTFMLWGGPKMVGLILLVEAIIPAGDMFTILAARGSTGRALGIHGVTAALMLAVGLPLALGSA